MELPTVMMRPARSADPRRKRMKQIGWTAADLRHVEVVMEVDRLSYHYTNEERLGGSSSAIGPTRAATVQQSWLYDWQRAADHALGA
jgi:hypothetical protein